MKRAIKILKDVKIIKGNEEHKDNAADRVMKGLLTGDSSYCKPVDNKPTISKLYPELLDKKSFSFVGPAQMGKFLIDGSKSDQLVQDSLALFNRLEANYRQNDQEVIMGTEITLNDYRTAFERVKTNGALAKAQVDDLVTKVNLGRMTEKFEAHREELLSLNNQLQLVLNDPGLIAALKDSMRNSEQSGGQLDLPKGVTERDGRFAIDISEFDPFKADLSKLDLLGEIKHFKYDLSKIDQNKYKYLLSLVKPDVIAKMESFLRLANGVLKSGCKYEMYKKNADLYRRVLIAYHSFRILQEMKQSCVKLTNLNDVIQKATESLIELREKNNDAARASKMNQSKRGEIFTDQATIYYSNPKKTDWEIQPKQSELKLLFSDNKTTREIASKINVLRGYYDLWQDKYQKNVLVQKALERPKTPDFDNDYVLTEGILNTDIANVSSDEHASLLENINRLTESLRNTTKDIARNMFKEKTKDSAIEDINQEDLNPLQLALKHAIVEVRNHDNFAKKWPTEYENPLYFDFKDPWLEIGMEKLGIKPENIKESHDKLLANHYAREVITNDVGNPANKAAYDCPPDKVIQYYEELIRDNAELKYIHSQLRDGFPAPRKPDRINGRDVLNTPADRLRCYIYALVLLDNPTLSDQELVEIADPIVEKLVKEGVSNYDDGHSIQQNEMIEMNSKAGRRAVEEVVQEEKRRKLNVIKPNRGLLVYQWYDGHIRCNEAYNKDYDEERNEQWNRTVEDSNEPWYAMFLDVGRHFEAMSKPGECEYTPRRKVRIDLSQKPNLEDIIRTSNVTIEDYEQQDENNNKEIEETLKSAQENLAWVKAFKVQDESLRREQLRKAGTNEEKFNTNVTYIEATLPTNGKSVDEQTYFMLASRNRTLSNIIEKIDGSSATV